MKLPTAWEFFEQACYIFCQWFAIFLKQFYSPASNKFIGLRILHTSEQFYLLHVKLFRPRSFNKGRTFSILPRPRNKKLYEPFNSWEDEKSEQGNRATQAGGIIHNYRA